ncbi:ATP-binding protein [Phenylobacterium sp.]|uniref:hybrid sensor histidine kinase/response regulator n=1 Tax=Phenylobacterium sp. TaxID=1871053 RepID=UPI0035B4DD95
MSGKGSIDVDLPRGRLAVRGVVAPALIIVAIVVLGSLSLLAYAGGAVDRMQLREERALASRAIDRSQENLTTDVYGVSHWDQAYLALSGKLDADWADVEIGDYLVNGRGHAMTLVLNRAGRPVYAWRGDGRVEPASLAGFAASAGPLIAKTRAGEKAAERAAAAAGQGRIGEPVMFGGVVSWNHGLYMTVVSTVEPETDVAPLRKGPGVLLISTRAIDATFLRDLDRDLQIAAARIVPPAARDAEDAAASIPLVGVDGRVAERLAWTPRQPGMEVLMRAAPALTTGFLALALAGWAFAARIRWILRELALNEAKLARTLCDLVSARDEAQAANVAKSQFLANMSHEIRTPLNGVLGMAQVMEREPLEPAQHERLRVIRDSGEALLTVLNDILDISKIEAGRLEIDNHDFDLDEVVHAAANPFAALAEEKGVGFAIDVDDDACGVWFGDSLRLRQVIANLASNAVKFTEAGEVRVAVAARDDGLDFRITDTGIGIPTERLGELFEKFSQVDASTSRRFGGTGLGLAICRELVVLMGGRLEVESQAGEGSNFFFHLPLERHAAPAPAPAEAPLPEAEDHRSLRILAAEDNATNRQILAALLEPLGVEVEFADDGAAAVAAFERGRFDMVLMDVQMPGMNGLEATVAIRTLEADRGAPPTPILAISANVMHHQIEQYLAVGMTGFVAKPIKAGELIAAIEAAASPAGSCLAA